MDEFLRSALNLLNETLATAIVVVAASMLLYNLSRNRNDRVARTSSIVLGCVTAAYISDVLVSLGPGLNTAESLLRLQWVGIAFIPAATFHLSDALLATTGLPSRGRRRRVGRILYLIAACFLIMAAFTDALIQPEIVDEQVSLRGGSVLGLYLFYFIVVNITAFINVERARRRCQTRSTKRRMAYLQTAMLTPAIGIFPYSVLIGPGEEFSITALILVNIANFIVILMLLFLAFPLSFFGSHVPDRVVKTELLRFMLRGPATGLFALVVIIFIDPTADMFGVPGDLFMPFATVAVILLWQWAIDIVLPTIEKRLIYTDEDDEQTVKLHQLSERYLSRGDLLQLLEAALEASCDFLHVNTAFLVGRGDNTGVEIVQSVGEIDTSAIKIDDAFDNLPEDAENSIDEFQVVQWQNYWIMPLYSQRFIAAENTAHQPLIGYMAVEARANTVDLDESEKETLHRTITRTEQTLDDLMLQSELYAAIEGLLPQISITREKAAEVEYRPGRNNQRKPEKTLDRNQTIEQVHAALRHYWGGPGLTRSRLLELNIVRNEVENNDKTPVNALRDVLKESIDQLRPEGQQDMRSPEWMLYNILTLRFIEKKKARDTARRLYLAEATLYRKQNIAISTLADALIKAEQASTHTTGEVTIK